MVRVARAWIVQSEQQEESIQGVRTYGTEDKGPELNAACQLGGKYMCCWQRRHAALSTQRSSLKMSCVRPLPALMLCDAGWNAS